MVIVESRKGKCVQDWRVANEEKPVFWWVHNGPQDFLLIPRGECEKIDEETYQWNRNIPDDPDDP
jgi:hypothetical protein